MTEEQRYKEKCVGGACFQVFFNGALFSFTSRVSLLDKNVI